MDYAPLGRTGLTASVIGVGTGGPSRVGLQGGGSEDNAEYVIREALDQGVNFIDTAEAYGTEEVVGRAIADVPRPTLIVSTKISNWETMDEPGVERAIDERLRRLGTDYLDICHIHAVTLEQYPYVLDRLVPGMIRAREKGKIRFLGVTERFNADPGHEMLSHAIVDGNWDVVMVGFNILNQSARTRVLAETQRRGIGVLAMFAVRLALSRRDRLVEVIEELISRGEIDVETLESVGGSRSDPLGWLVNEDVPSVVDAAYRFVRHAPGIDVTLSGTGSLDHMNANIESAQRLPLDLRTVEALARLFNRVDSVTGQ